MDRIHKGVSELEFRAQDIPEHAMRIAGMALFEMTERILKQPGGRKMLDAETARRHLRQRDGTEKTAPK